jgi:hypothetical protein
VTLPQPSPRSWDPGDIGSVALLNTHVRDAFTFLSNRPVFVGVQLNAQSIPNAVSPFTKLTWDAPLVDTYNGLSVVTNPTRYTVPFFGIWLVYAVVNFPVNATGRRLSQIFWNGTSEVQTEVQPAANAGQTTVPDWFVGPAAAGDYFEFGVYQSSGAAMNTVVSPVDQSSYFQVVYLGGSL